MQEPELKEETLAWIKTNKITPNSQSQQSAIFLNYYADLSSLGKLKDIKHFFQKHSLCESANM
jgi:hypothetical protein